MRCRNTGRGGRRWRVGDTGGELGCSLRALRGRQELRRSHFVTSGVVTTLGLTRNVLLGLPASPARLNRETYFRGHRGTLVCRCCQSLSFFWSGSIKQY